MGQDFSPTADSLPTEACTTPVLDSPQRSTEPTALPWITCIILVLCVGICLGLSIIHSDESPESLAHFGYLPADRIWNGEYWGLVTSVFVHLALWHLALNVYWLWKLGSRMERAMGPLRYFGFVIHAACISSSYQLAVSDTTGIGASGVVYAIYGFMWVTRHRYPAFPEVLSPKVVRWFNTWLVACFVVSYHQLYEIGNAAHLSGLLFGVSVAGSLILFEKRNLSRCGWAALLVGSIVPLFWCPWSIGWHMHRAYNAHVAERYESALKHYSVVIERDPENAWAYANRSGVYLALGHPEQSQADLRKAHEIDPSLQQPK